ncbi:hypothetical protein E4U60_001384 [Claviceps pazoutovae]|uniref:Uncharacterized protein n=1 Tax=Claviceps pazoutovae TaxID=1649127 RepID=A0A9P7MCQ9_9HYPO|nr:hypothetical protein E4U60_001384 [Claviceps pazoutovae]
MAISSLARQYTYSASISRAFLSYLCSKITDSGVKATETSSSVYRLAVASRLVRALHPNPKAHQANTAAIFERRSALADSKAHNTMTRRQYRPCTTVLQLPQHSVIADKIKVLPIRSAEQRQSRLVRDAPLAQQSSNTVKSSVGRLQSRAANGQPNPPRHEHLFTSDYPTSPYQGVREYATRQRDLKASIIGD